MAPAVERFVRVLKVGALVVVTVVVVRLLRGRRTPQVTGEASWPPLTEPDTTPTSTRLAAPLTLAEPETEAEPEAPQPEAAEPEPETEPGSAGAAWVEPIDGACPASHPIKGNAGSGIYHVPGGMFYDRTSPERCYVSAEAAESDGFRPAKR